MLTRFCTAKKFAYWMKHELCHKLLFPLMNSHLIITTETKCWNSIIALHTKDVIFWAVFPQCNESAYVHNKLFWLFWCGRSVFSSLYHPFVQKPPYTSSCRSLSALQTNAGKYPLSIGLLIYREYKWWQYVLRALFELPHSVSALGPVININVTG